jgi:hypothetical protein
VRITGTPGRRLIREAAPGKEPCRENCEIKEHSAAIEPCHASPEVRKTLQGLRRLALTLAPLGVLAKIFIDKRRAQSSPDECRLLDYLAQHTARRFRSSTPSSSSRLNRPCDSWPSAI